MGKRCPGKRPVRGSEASRAASHGLGSSPQPEAPLRVLLGTAQRGGGGLGGPPSEASREPPKFRNHGSEVRLSSASAAPGRWWQHGSL